MMCRGISQKRTSHSWRPDWVHSKRIVYTLAWQLYAVAEVLYVKRHELSAESYEERYALVSEVAVTLVVNNQATVVW